MKTRIISGIVMGIIVAAVLAAGMLWNTAVIVFFVALLAAGASYELIRNAAGIKEVAATVGACIYSFAAVCLLLGNEIGIKDGSTRLFRELSVIYFIFAVCVTLKCHKSFSLADIVTLAAIPMVLAFGFSCIGGVINHNNGIYYLLLTLNFSCVCDMGAYFVGSACGKHKLCPEISPKKTVEGAVGGVVSSLIVTVIILLCFNRAGQLPQMLLLTVPFCILGMFGDLFASAIKRSVGLKDYSHLIPGHGGILDRFDSILLIAPAFYMCAMRGII